MSENPISTSLPGYRLLVIKYLPNLEKLDDVAVTYQEKDIVMNMDDNEIMQKHETAKKEYVQTTFIPNESQNYLNKKKQ